MEEDDDDSDYPEEMEDDDDDDASYCTESSFRSHSTYSSTPGTHPARLLQTSSPPPPPSLLRGSLPLWSPPTPTSPQPPNGGEMRRPIKWQKTRFTRGKRRIVQNGDCIVAVLRPHARSLACSLSPLNPLFFLLKMCASAVSPPGIVETLAHTYPLHSFFSPCFGLVFWNERSFLFCKPLCISNVVSFRFFVYNRFLKKGNGGFRQIVPYKHTHTQHASLHTPSCVVLKLS